jgi:hypothetical protein
MYGLSEIRYVTLNDDAKPILLARVRWPDVAEAISFGCSDWQTDPGLFDLPYDPSGVEITLDRAEEIAAQWGVHLPDGPSVLERRPSLIRRMPANWSDLTSAERRAWSVAVGPMRRRNRRKRARSLAPKKTRGRSLRAVFVRTSRTSDSRARTEEADVELLASIEALGPPVPTETSVRAAARAPVIVPCAVEYDDPESPPSVAPAHASEEARYLHSNDPRLTGLRLPVGGARVATRPGADPSPIRPRPGIR